MKKETAQNDSPGSKKENGLTRRSFVRSSAVVAAGLALGGTLPGAMTGCSDLPDWQPISYPKMLLYNCSIFTGTDNYLKKDHVILVNNGRIEALEKRGDLSQYKGYRKVDMEGMALLPGMIDNHVHITVPFTFSVTPAAVMQMDRQIANNMRSCVMGGVTTIRDVGGFPGKILKYRDLADEMKIPGPRVVSSLSPIAARDGDRLGAPETAPYFTSPLMKWFLGGNYAERPVGVKEIEEACLRMIELGARWLKTLHQDHDYSYNKRALPNHSDEGYRKILEIGRKNGLKCALHEPLVSGFQKGVELGFHTLEHMPLDGIIPDRDIDAFIRKEMAIMPTLMAYRDVICLERVLKLVEEKGDTFLTGEARKQSMEAIGEEMKITKEGAGAGKGAPGHDSGYTRDMLPNQVANLRKIERMGGTVGIGTDNGGYFCGYFGRYSDELKYYVDLCGISPAETLKKATSLNAKIIDMDKEVGSIAKGKRADIIGVRGNPLSDIDVMDTVSLVARDGQVYRADGISGLS